MMSAAGVRYPVQDEKKTPAARRPFGFRLIDLLLVSLVMSIVIEWSSMLWLYNHSAAHSRALVNEDIGYLNDDFTNTIVGYSQADLISEGVMRVYHALFRWSMIEVGLRRLGESIGIPSYIDALFNIVIDFLVRVGIVLFSLPLFLLFAVVGITSGLTLRDIRRWSGGREFGGVYHNVKLYVPKALLLVWFLYLTLPVSVHPNVVVLPCAVLLALTLTIFTATYKKYL